MVDGMRAPHILKFDTTCSDWTTLFSGRFTRGEPPPVEILQRFVESITGLNFVETRKMPSFARNRFLAAGSHITAKGVTPYTFHTELQKFSRRDSSVENSTHTHTTSFGTSTLKYYLYGRSFDKFRLRTAGTGITSTCLARVLHPLLCIILTYTTGTLCRRLIYFISNKKVTQ